MYKRQTYNYANFNNPSNPYSIQTFTYTTELLPSKIFINMPQQIVNRDNLTGVTTTQSFTYDSYKNPLNILNSFAGGSQQTVFTYLNNPSGTNQNYYIGRLIKKSESSTLGSESLMKEEQYTYNNNLLSLKKVRGQGTPWISESYQHDTYGNITKKTLSASGLSSRVEKYGYDYTGRFLTSYTNIEGLTTQFYYNNKTGNLVSETNPFGLSTYYEYDSWYRRDKEINYLYNETVYSFDRISTDGKYTISESVEGGMDKVTTYDALNRSIKESITSINNQWVEKSMQYDILDRAISTSEPYFSNSSPTQWNTVEFDQYGRVVSQESYTGRITTITYNGLITTVDEDSKITITQKDHAGNVIKIQDPGGIVNYTYYPNGTIKTASYGGNIVSTAIDAWGRKTQLSDPSAGNYAYLYNLYGELTKETSPNGITYNFYDGNGKLVEKKVEGNLTSLTATYYYHPTTKQLISIEGFDHLNNKNYKYLYKYDTYKRLNYISEENNDANFTRDFSFDTFGRMSQDILYTKNLSDGVSVIVKTHNIYDPNGLLIEIQDEENISLWKLNSLNAKQQPLSFEFGNGINGTNGYDVFGFPSHISHGSALHLVYEFNSSRGTLTKRRNFHLNYWENFAYDNLDRLTNISGNASHAQTYFPDGRIKVNSSIGEYFYSPTKKYQITSLGLNNQGENYYNSHSSQEITYNVFKGPVSINEEGQGKVDFEYNILQSRSHAYYGGQNPQKQHRYFYKHYSAISPVEIILDQKERTTKIITYVGGSAYSAPLVYVKQYSSLSSINSYFYLHRDYLGSILAITDESGNIVEEAQFGAWGKVDHFTSIYSGNEFNYRSLLGRGFTGHEHFEEVGLIHMNGRMYDPMLSRFLSPDNYVQNPYNPQNFNRYGYVLNNPLMYTDPTGEFAFAPIIAGVLIGAAAAAVTYTIPAIASGNWNLGDFGKSILFGAATGAVTGIFSAAGAAMGANAVMNGASGAFWQSTTFSILSNVVSQTGVNLAFGNQITLGIVVGAAVGGYIGGKMPSWVGTKGGYFRNAFGEIGLGSIKGGFTGTFSGGISAAIDGGNVGNGMMIGMRNGAIGGASQSLAMIAVFGATYKPTKSQLADADKMASGLGISTDDVAWRIGGIYQFFQPRITKWLNSDFNRYNLPYYRREVTWGNNVATFNSTSAAIFGHEFGHIFQNAYQGWAKFQGTGIIEQLFQGHSAYSTLGTNEYGAEFLLHIFASPSCINPNFCTVP